ncbi:oxidoreductase [Reticulibacter mediterranei]|uniref:Oxidoreductase n=1 Tax=Reticulibacter mediterranei TaxID=2778369 RepID=A0A8J3IKS7_9CHLR|nr:aldo/keto reductase [Reticulibacter mediterranei]GHO93057.1 oxidoreductase [Reticulibacter mediterranei]
MQYAMLGKTGLVVSRFALGTGNFGKGVQHGGAGHMVDQQQADAIVAASIEAGINFFDTANVYGSGFSEEILGRALGAQRKEVVLATKIGRRTSNALIDAGLSYRNVIAAVEASLKRLDTDYIDLLYLHISDPLTPYEETARGLDYLVQRGLVRYIGFSNFTSWQAASFLAIQQQNRYASFVAGQMQYSLLERGIEYEVAPFSQYAGLGLLTYSPLAGGFLTGKYTQENPTGTVAGREGRLAFSARASDREAANAIVEKLHEIAAHREATPSQIALAWLLTKPYVTSVILGAGTLEQFSDNVKAADLSLSPEEIEALGSLTALKEIYPYLLPGGGRDRMIERALGHQGV